MHRVTLFACLFLASCVSRQDEHHIEKVSAKDCDLSGRVEGQLRFHRATNFYTPRCPDISFIVIYFSSESANKGVYPLRIGNRLSFQTVIAKVDEQPSDKSECARRVGRIHALAEIDGQSAFESRAAFIQPLRSSALRNVRHSGMVHRGEFGFSDAADDGPYAANLQHRSFSNPRKHSSGLHELWQHQNDALGAPSVRSIRRREPVGESRGIYRRSDRSSRHEGLGDYRSRRRVAPLYNRRSIDGVEQYAS